MIFASSTILSAEVLTDFGLRYYPECPSEKVKLDMYYPSGSKDAPCILLIHGGGWSNGDEKRFAPMATFFAENGYVVACITYRLLPEFTLRACVEDCKYALLWLKKNAPKYGGSPEKIAVMGGSAGGHLSTLLATSGKSDLMKEIFPPGMDASVAVCVGMAPVTDIAHLPSAGKLLANEPDLAQATKDFSPITYASAQMPPMLLIHAKGDKIVPVANSEKLKKLANDFGTECSLIVWDCEGHGFWNPASPISNDTLQTALKFLDSKLK